MSLSKATFFAVAAMAGASEEGMGHVVTLHKAAYPERLVRQRPACGETNMTKSLLSADYWAHVMLGGFREGSCADAGYQTFESEVSVEEKLPLLHKHEQRTFRVYTREPNAVDVAECMVHSCKAEMRAIAHSGYTRDVAKCIKPGFGPCVPKIWDCLGDESCRATVKCLPKVGVHCGHDVVAALEDKEVRDKLMCIEKCGSDKICVLSKCGKGALSCLLGIDKVCHRALVCVPDGIVDCSKDSLKCLLSDGLCRQNFECLWDAAKTCADPAVNWITDANIAKLVTCNNQKCPPVADMPQLLESVQSVDVEELVSEKLELVSAEFPKQVACMGLHCTGKLISLLSDRDVDALTNCLPDAFGTCYDDVFNCFADEKCLADFHCWTDGLVGTGRNLWKMITDGPERALDTELFHCIMHCKAEANPLSKAACMAAKCGPKAAKCLADTTCRKLVEDLPATAIKCGPRSVLDALNGNSTFSKALFCGVKVVDRCGSEGVEFLRDSDLADLALCNSQCTRAPGGSPDAEEANPEAIVVV